METLPPPQDHVPPIYRYTWDENGEVAQVSMPDTAQTSSSQLAIWADRANDEQQQLQQQQQQQHLSPPECPTRSERQSTQWPFQSIALGSEPEIPSPTHHHRASSQSQYHAWQPPNQQYGDSSQPQYHAWQPPNQHHRDGNADQGGPAVGRDIDPNHLASFLRGETPPSAFQKESGGVHGGGKITDPQHGIVGLVANHQYQQHRSRVADFEGFRLSEDPVSSPLGRVQSRESAEEQLFLSLGEKAAAAGEWGGLTDGWRAGVALNVLAMFLMLVAGFICLVVAISGLSLDAGRLAIFAGSCAEAKHADWGLHAVVGVFVVVLVAGANYVFQVLSSPTREEVTAAHQKKKWLDIGIPSFRNLRRIEASRVVLAVVVLLSAVFTQIMYNAVIFVSQTAPNYKAAVVTEPFLKGAPFSTGTGNIGGLSRDDLLTLQQQAGRNELVRLAVPVCIDQFDGSFEADYTAVLLISNTDSPTLIQTSKGANTSTMAALISDQSIQYCLARPAPSPTCEINLNAPLLGVVALLNSTALVATAAALFKRPSSFRPLATLGDAISSFLEDPDPTTQNACLLSKRDIKRGRWPPPEAKYWVPKNHYWLCSVSFPRWITTASIWAACAGLTAAGLAIAITNDPLRRLSPFGVASPHALIFLPPNISPAAAAIVASLPQLLLAMLYLAVNALFSTYFLSHESSHFATGPVQPLRVSCDAISSQTTSSHLTLPRAVSTPLIILFAAMSFTLSQSIFAVSIRLTDTPTSQPNENDTTIVALGLSGLALLALLSMLILLLLITLALGLRRAPPVGEVNGERVGNPMVLAGGSCSAVVSARCHPLAREKGLAGRAVMWGVVREGVGFGQSHCAFTAGGRAGVVEAGRDYA